MVWCPGGIQPVQPLTHLTYCGNEINCTCREVIDSSNWDVPPSEHSVNHID